MYALFIGFCFWLMILICVICKLNAVTSARQGHPIGTHASCAKQRMGETVSSTRAYLSLEVSLP